MKKYISTKINCMYRGENSEFKNKFNFKELSIKNSTIFKNISRRLNLILTMQIHFSEAEIL